MNDDDKAPRVLIELDSYDHESREYGDCAKAALKPIGSLMGMSICGLEFGHDGPHEWDPDFEWADYEDEED